MADRMPARPRTAPTVAAVVAVLAYAIPAIAAAGLVSEPEKADLITTGNDSELIDSVPIATAPGLADRVAMSLGPEELPRLEAGDRVRVGAEVQVSTTCVERGPRCVGRRYDFNPRLYARIELADSASPDAARVGLSETREVKCTQRRPNRNHHCTIALPNTETVIGDPATLPCPANACYVNLIVGAYHPRARQGNVVVLGADRPDASVAQDKGRLNVVHARAPVPAPTEASSNVLINSDLPLTEGKKVKRRVIFSVEVPPPKKGEVLAVDGGYVANIKPLPFNVFVSSRLIVAESPTAIESTGVANASSSLRGDASEGNGFNCTQGPSGFSTPCKTEKSGAIRITRDAVDASGSPVPLYVNLVSSAEARLTEEVSDRQRVLALSGDLRVTRFQPAEAASVP
jgi:hypothetical protein